MLPLLGCPLFSLLSQVLMKIKLEQSTDSMITGLRTYIAR